MINALPAPADSHAVSTPEPGEIPLGQVLVHNYPRSTTGRPGTRGSRICGVTGR